MSTVVIFREIVFNSARRYRSMKYSQIDRQIYRQIDRQIDRWIDRLIDIQRDRYICIYYTQIERKIDRQIYRQIDFLRFQLTISIWKKQLRYAARAKCNPPSLVYRNCQFVLLYLTKDAGSLPPTIYTGGLDKKVCTVFFFRMYLLCKKPENRSLW